MRSTTTARTLAAVALVCTATAAVADDDRFSLTISGFRPSSSTEISADAGTVAGQQIDFEDTFSLAR